MRLTIRLTLYFVLVCSSISGRSQSVTNPILAGFYPDPSICRAGDDYYLTNSSFAYYPGLPIFHSKDLLNWKQIGYAMDRPEQHDLDGHGVSRGLFAPAISYHNGLFYIVCTKVDRVGNFVITTKDPKGPWSNPVSLPEVNGIDPALFFDDNKAYIVYNSIPPENKSLYGGHRTIRMREFDATALKTTGEEKILVNGGTDISKKPVWIEAPHIIKREGWYYLLCAEGGTGYNHSEVIFRSRSVDGPYVPFEKNPILTQRHLDTSRKHPITTTGHADFVEGKDGKWWAVFLGCRPYEGDFYNTGRETFIAPVEWKDGWLQFNLGGDEVKYSYPINARIDKKAEKFNGNYHFRDEFDKPALNVRYNFLRTVREKWYSLSNGALTINLRPDTCSGRTNPSFIGFHQPHLKGYAATSMRFTAVSDNEKAGLMIFQNEKNHYFLCQTIKEGKQEVQLYKGNELIASNQIDNSKDGLQLKIEAKDAKYAFYYAGKKNNWRLLLDNVDGKYLSTKVAGGFVGCLYTLYATSNGKPTTNKAIYDWFECKNDDDVYKNK
ncbi:MAG TPA: glycoside hydrolase family 43 protein [Chitinophagaceae bacterium]